MISAVLLVLCLGNAIAQNKNISFLEKIEAIDKEPNIVIKTSNAAGFAMAIVVTMLYMLKDSVLVTLKINYQLQVR